MLVVYFDHVGLIRAFRHKARRAVFGGSLQCSAVLCNDERGESSSSVGERFAKHNRIVHRPDAIRSPPPTGQCAGAWRFDRQNS